MFATSTMTPPPMCNTCSSSLHFYRPTMFVQGSQVPIQFIRTEKSVEDSALLEHEHKIKRPRKRHTYDIGGHR